MDSETPEGESIDYPRLRAAQAIKLNFLVDVQQEKFREVSETDGAHEANGTDETHEADVTGFRGRRRQTIEIKSHNGNTTNPF